MSIMLSRLLTSSMTCIWVGGEPLGVLRSTPPLRVLQAWRHVRAYGTVCLPTLPTLAD